MLNILHGFFFSFQTKSICFYVVSGCPSWFDSSLFLKPPSVLLVALWTLFRANSRERGGKVACHWLCPDCIGTVPEWPAAHPIHIIHQQLRHWGPDRPQELRLGPKGCSCTGLLQRVLEEGWTVTSALGKAMCTSILQLHNHKILERKGENKV